jgi:hypothetical protein
MANSITPDDADRLADLLNHVCSLTIEALESGDVVRRLGVASSLREFRAKFGEDSAVGPFLALLVGWLEGQRPGAARCR